MGKSKGLSMNYNKDMKLEVFKLDADGNTVDLLDTFLLDDVKDLHE